MYAGFFPVEPFDLSVNMSAFYGKMCAFCKRKFAFDGKLCVFCKRKFAFDGKLCAFCKKKFAFDSNLCVFCKKKFAFNGGIWAIIVNRCRKYRQLVSLNNIFPEYGKRRDYGKISPALKLIKSMKRAIN